MNAVSNLDKRCYDILKRIMYAGGYLKIQELAEEMQSSKRSVYYDINKINDWLQERGIEELIQERGKGIIVNHTQIKAIQDALSETSSDTNHLFTRDERVKIQICSIIIRSNPLYIEDFMESCQVSRNTIINDLKSVAQFLEIYNLTLSYDIKRGYRIVGDIIRKRALFFMLFPSLWEYYERKLIPAVDEESVQHNLHLLKQIEKELQAEYVSGILPSLALFLSSVDKRNDRLTFNDMDEEEIVETKEYHLVSQKFVRLAPEEKIYVTLHLLGSRLQTIPVNVMKDQDETYEISKNLVHEFERLTCVYFDQEEELINAINAHLKTSLYRYRYGIQLGNPMLDSIETEYEELYEITKKSCEYLERTLGY
ncbi:MAG: transcription antiterminator, partial [Longicatena sp.]